jgi:Fe2+ or Zn2+ uptake regulation protein
MKRIADTSRAALREIAPSLPSRATEVFEALARYWAEHHVDPTAYELLRWMQIANPVLDLNAVRPRLTELKDAGFVQTGDKRCCAVTEKRVYTWHALSSPATRSPADRPTPAIAIQDALF